MIVNFLSSYIRTRQLLEHTNFISLIFTHVEFPNHELDLFIRHWVVRALEKCFEFYTRNTKDTTYSLFSVKTRKEEKVNQEVNRKKKEKPERKKERGKQRKRETPITELIYLKLVLIFMNVGRIRRLIHKNMITSH